MARFPRKKKLVQPGLQLRLIASFVGLSTLAMLLQFVFLGGRLMQAVSGLDDGGGQIADEIPGLMLSVLGVSLLLFVPLVFALGLLLTNRIAGPAYNLERYVRRVARGEETEPCRIRKGDELQSLCDAVNELTEPLRTRAQDPTADEAPALRRAG